MRVALRRQDRDTPTHLIKIPNLHMMDVLLKIDCDHALYVRATSQFMSPVRS